MQRKKKQLIPTEKGTNLIAVLPDNIKSPILTAEWESRLKQVERGELSAESFMEGIADMSRALVKEHTAPEERFASLFPDAKGKAHEAVGVCPRCGASYHVRVNPPKQDGICDACGTALIVRPDDAPETVRDRLHVYHEQTEPLKGFYEKLGLLHSVENVGSIEDVSREIFRSLGIVE